MKLAPHATECATRHSAAAQPIEHDLVELIAVGPLELDLIERRAKRGDRSIELLPREFRLLEYMMRRKGRVLSREMPSERYGSTSSFQRPTSWTCIWAGFGARSMGRLSRL
jgi:DNA-binding response OmpR family regulator